MYQIFHSNNSILCIDEVIIHRACRKPDISGMYTMSLYETFLSRCTHFALTSTLFKLYIFFLKRYARRGKYDISTRKLIYQGIIDTISGPKINSMHQSISDTLPGILVRVIFLMHLLGLEVR
jgi:Ni,Fe-hydrogenase I cytochrome b subunit